MTSMGDEAAKPTAALVLVYSSTAPLTLGIRSICANKGSKGIVLDGPLSSIHATFH